MASTWGTSWGTSWAVAWEIDTTPSPLEPVSRYAMDGSMNIVLDTGPSDFYEGWGIYARNGAVRINVTDSGPGLFARDGAFRGTISTDEGSPAPGLGIYLPSGGLRLTAAGSAYFLHPGHYARDGSIKVTVLG